MRITIVLSIIFLPYIVGILTYHYGAWNTQSFDAKTVPLYHPPVMQIWGMGLLYILGISILLGVGYAFIYWIITGEWVLSD